MNSNETRSPAETERVDLRNPWIAGLLAWLIPGAGHFYQRRWEKGILFFVCVLGTFYYGIMLGSSHVVYASLRPNDPRSKLVFIPQVMVGAPTAPAVVQYIRIKGQQAPLWNNYMAPPLLINQEVPTEWAEQEWSKSGTDLELKEDDFETGTIAGYKRYVPKIHAVRLARDRKIPDPELNEKYTNQLSVWNNRYGYRYELGTTFTMIAGLLNLLVIYDAVRGPAFGYRMYDHAANGRAADPATELATAGKAQEAEKAPG